MIRSTCLQILSPKNFAIHIFRIDRRSRILGQICQSFKKNIFIPFRYSLINITFTNAYFTKLLQLAILRLLLLGSSERKVFKISLQCNAAIYLSSSCKISTPQLRYSPSCYFIIQKYLRCVIFRYGCENSIHSTIIQFFSLGCQLFLLLKDHLHWRIRLR